MNKTTSGLWIAAEPYLRLPLDAPSRSLADAVLGALGKSAEGVPHPADWKGFANARLTAFGVSSEAKLVAGARMIDVESDGERIMVVPSRNGGSRGPDRGFQALRGKAISAGSDQCSLAMAIAQGFEECVQ